MSEKKPYILLCAVGDIALGGSLEGAFETSGGAGELASQISPLFTESDIGFSNLDCTFDTTGEPPRPDEYLVHATPGQLDILKELGIDIVSQANNHSLDFGGEGLVRTQRHLEARGIKYVGAGPDLERARSPVIVECKGRRVGFLAYASTHPWVDAWAATGESAGVAPLDIEFIREDISALRNSVDGLVVSLHWGKEYIHYPPPENVKLARQLVDWGVDLVLGHHPHVIQGIEQYGRGLICYSLGNFLFPDYGEQRLVFREQQRISLLVRCKLSEGADLIDVVLVRQEEGGRLVPLAGTEESILRAELSRLSKALERPDYGTFWRSQARRHELRRLWRVFNEEVIEAGWKGGSARLLQLGSKNFRSIGRSFSEIFSREG